MNRVLRNQFAGRRDASVDSLNGLMSERQVASDGDVNVTVWNLQHCSVLSEWRDCNRVSRSTARCVPERRR
jgi:hypothetical protein